MVTKPDLIIVMNTGIFIKIAEKNVYEEIEHKDLELAYLALCLTEYLDKSNNDRTFLKSRLRHYLMEN